MQKLTILAGLSVLLSFGCNKTIDARKPSVTGIDPNVVCNALETQVTISGTNFDPLPVGAPVGTYNVQVKNPLGPTGVGVGLMQIVPPPTLNALNAVPPGIFPQSGGNDVATPVTISGTNFRPNPTVTLTLHGGGTPV